MAASKASQRNGTKQHTKGSLFRSFIIGVLIAVGTIGIGAYVAVSWTEQNILNTDKWVETVAPLPSTPAVADGLSAFVVSKVFDSGAVQQQVQEALPPRAAFLAAPLTTQLQNLVGNLTRQVITSDVFTNIWTRANRRAHEAVLERARNPGATTRAEQFSLDLSETRARIRERLGITSPILPVRQAGEPLAIQADLQTRPQKIGQYIRAVDFAYAVLPAAIFASLLTALAVARNRRKALLIMSVSVSIIALLQLIGVKALRPVVLDKVQQASYHPAVGDFYDKLLGSFNGKVYVVLGIAVFVWLLTLLAGSNRFFRWLRKYMKTSTFRKTDWYAYWREIRMLVAAYKVYVWAALVVIALAWLAFVGQVEWETVTNTILWLIAGMAFVQILGSPPYFIKVKK